MLSHLLGVMAGIVPAIHACLLKLGKKDVDARDKRGHDDGERDSITKEKTQSQARLKAVRLGR